MKLCKCIYCQKQFQTTKRISKYCTPVCRASDYTLKNKEKVFAYKVSYYIKNKEEINVNSMANYYFKKQVLEKRTCNYCGTEYQPTRTDRKFCSSACGVINWQNNNKDHVNLWSKEKYHTDINHKLRICLRSRLHKALKGNIRSKGTMLLLGCTIEEFKNYLESKFEPWMNWENHGVYNKNKKTWQIDHIRPMSDFDLTNPDEQQEACHYSNLQPLLAKSNLIKGAKYE